MPNAKDIVAGANSSILVVGDGGTGKTRFCATIPGLYIFDFDGGLASIRGQDVEYDTFKDAPRGVPIDPKVSATTGLYTFGTAWPAFFKKLQDIGKLIDAGKGPKAIAFDSLTLMSMIAVNKILIDTGQPAPHQGTWGAHHEYFKAIFSQVTNWPIRVIATAHIQRTENDLTKVDEKLPLLAGKLAGMIGIFFDEVWYTTASANADGKTSFKIQTTPTPQVKAKSRLNIPNNTEADWEAVSKFFNPTAVKK